MRRSENAIRWRPPSCHPEHREGSVQGGAARSGTPEAETERHFLQIPRFLCSPGMTNGGTSPNRIGITWILVLTIEDTIHIEASPDVVWAVTEDIERWPEWTPTVEAAYRLDDGPFGHGSVARIKQPGQPESDWTVTAYAPGEHFTWETRRPGLRMAASHRVRGETSGTSNTLRVKASGALAVMLRPVLRRAIRRALMEENRGLKARCEAFSASSPTA